jgi:alginate O-acetyltransferase complex protein AlgI
MSSHALASLRFWIGSALLLAVFAHSLVSIHSLQSAPLIGSLELSFIPLVSVMALTFLVSRVSGLGCQVLCYLLFFSISVTSLLGLTQTLTGSHAESPSLLLYGLSFYTASLAYLLHGRTLTYPKAILAGNPLLLITGPIVVGFSSVRHWGLARRFYYFFPFIVFGAFLHQTIATPLTNTFDLIERTDLVSSLVFAVLFELFVYANFCGLSLLVYGVAGVLGVKVPLNFKQPFSASNLIDFWKGWHTSLSLVLKTLFYNPVRSKFGTYGAILIVYVASAMWHGVTLNFLLWGLFHAACFVLTIFILKSGAKFITIPLMLVGIVVGRMLFADSQTDRLFQKLTFQFVDFGVFDYLGQLAQADQLAILIIVLMVSAEFFFRKTAFFRQRRYKFYRLPLVQILMLTVMLLLLSQTSGLDYAVYGQR